MFMSLPACAEFRVHHAEHQCVPGSIVIASYKPRPTRDCRSLYLELIRPRFRAHLDVHWFAWSQFARILATTFVEGAVSVPKPYPEEFRRTLLDLVAADTARRRTGSA